MELVLSCDLKMNSPIVHVLWLGKCLDPIDINFKSGPKGTSASALPQFYHLPLAQIQWRHALSLNVEMGQSEIRAILFPDF